MCRQDACTTAGEDAGGIHLRMSTPGLSLVAASLWLVTQNSEMAGGCDSLE
jgi:hypothetical protein